MRVLINALYLNWGVNGGTETYFHNIVQEWYDRPPNAETKFTLICTSAPHWFKSNRLNFKIVEKPLLKSLAIRILYEQVAIPFLYKDYVIFNPGYVGILLHCGHQVTTIHDTYAWLFPNEAGRFRSLYWRLLISSYLRMGCSSICVSENTRNDLIACKAAGPNGNLKTIHESGSHIKSIDADPKILSKHNLKTDEFFFSIGIFKKVKNPEVIIEAYKTYRSKCANCPKNLVLAGHSNSTYAKSIIELARNTEGVICIGRISDAELSALYRNSAALVFVTLYEGFGIPILEAQELGCPVLTSNSGSMPEVAGPKGALFANPSSIEEIADKLLMLDNTHVRQNLASLGSKNAKLFKWSQARYETLQLLISKSPFYKFYTY